MAYNVGLTGSPSLIACSMRRFAVEDDRIHARRAPPNRHPIIQRNVQRKFAC